MKPEICECLTWCSDGRAPFISHLKGCKHYNLERDSIDLVKSLIKALEDWAADEDGIHPDAWNDYLKALIFIGDFKKFNKVSGIKI